MKLSKLLGALSIICGLAIMVGPWTFAYACMGMKDGVAVCHTTRLYALGAGAIIAVLGILLIKIKVYFLDKLFSLLLFAAGIGTILVPTYLAPVCRTATMHCRAVMLPFLIVMGAVVAFLGMLFLLKGVKREKPVAETEAPLETTPEDSAGSPVSEASDIDEAGTSEIIEEEPEGAVSEEL